MKTALTYISQVFGSTGMIHSGNEYETGVTSHAESGSCHGKMKYSFQQRYDLSYKQALEHFVDVCKGRRVDSEIVKVTSFFKVKQRQK